MQGVVSRGVQPRSPGTLGCHTAAAAAVARVECCLFYRLTFFDYLLLLPYRKGGAVGCSVGAYLSDQAALFVLLGSDAA